MNFDNRFEGAENDNWLTLGAPVTKQESLVTESDNKDFSHASYNQGNKKAILSPVLTFQLIVCLIVLTLAFVAKTFFIELYETAKTEYDRELTASMYFDGKIKQDNYDAMFTSQTDES